MDDPVIQEPSTDEPDKENECTREDSPPALFANLETRRKRRTSALIREPPEESEDKPEHTEVAKQAQLELPLKAGAKRKFGTQEQENEELRPTKSDGQNFSFSRKSGNAIDKSMSRQIVQLPERATSRSEERVKHASGEVRVRRALGESKFDAIEQKFLLTRIETVNTDPIVSPVKPRSIPEKVNQTDFLARVKDRQRQKQSSKVESVKVAPDAIVIPPTTPASLEHDLFSPTDSIPSADAGRSAPLLSELTSKAAENTRPSRRQRAQVSYAEPSLRDKMRRPGKELADAIVIEKVVKEGSPNKPDHAEISGWKPSLPENPAPIAQPTSPLQSKSSSTEDVLLSPLIIDRRRKSMQPASNVDTKDATSDISRTLTTALASSQKRLTKAREAAIQKPIETSSSDVFATDGSSPETAAQSSSSALSKHSRRHSSMSNIRIRGDVVASRPKIEGRTSGEEILASGAERIASRRRSMLL